MKKIRTHYDNLQVVETASDEVIKGAYRYLSQKWHPDKHPHHREAAERKMKIINAAYEVLSDPQRRKEHDEWIAAQRAAQGADTPSSTGPDPWPDDTQDRTQDRTQDPPPRPDDPEPHGKPPFPKWRIALLIAVVVAVGGYVKGVVPGEPHLDKPFRDPLQIGGFGPEMVSLPGGTFTMGSPASEQERAGDEGPQHRVTVPAFALGRTEVSFADYDRFAEATGRKKPADRWGRGNQPVINVSQDDARAYATWLSEQTGQQYRLPTEAEWEYAARAGTTTPFWTGDCISTQQANYDGNVDYDACGAKTGRYRAQTVPVGSLPANAFGLHEMAGNVYEWTADCWHDGYAGAPTDGSAWRGANGGDCARRVLRGGSWYNGPLLLRSADRYWFTADDAGDFVGIRLARTP